MIIERAQDRDRTISVEVGPGGGLRDITLSEHALRLGRAELAATIVGLVRLAAARANERARHTLRDEFGELNDMELDALGVAPDRALTEEVESTTPDTWRI